MRIAQINLCVHQNNRFFFVCVDDESLMMIESLRITFIGNSIFSPFVRVVAAVPCGWRTSLHKIVHTKNLIEREKENLAHKRAALRTLVTHTYTLSNYSWP